MRECDPLTDEEVDKFTSYADGESQVRRKRTEDGKPISFEQLAQIALNENIEKCLGCGWWVESSELLDDDNNVTGRCESCRQYSR